MKMTEMAVRRVCANNVRLADLLTCYAAERR